MKEDQSTKGNRREFLLKAGALGLASLAGSRAVKAAAPDVGATRLFTAPDQPNPPTITMPFENGDRPLVQYPEKRPLIRLTTRPPQLETPFEVFNEGILTPNDAFYVRYHNNMIPQTVDPVAFRVAVSGNVASPLTLSLDDLRTNFEEIDVIAVNECSGNGRGFSNPRVPGGQLGNGAMGNARWTGVRLKDVLNKAGVGPGAVQVTFNGLDDTDCSPPDLVKALEIDHALDGTVLLAYAMNGEELPMLNGYPLRLVVPGYYGTYWVKHVNDIQVINDVFTGFYMASAYRIPPNECACIPPGTSLPPGQMVPINQLNVRSFITSHMDGSQIFARQATVVKGIAFDGGSGIKAVLFSEDGGATWHETRLGPNFGGYSFREWGTELLPRAPGDYILKARAISNDGKSQPLDPLWNPSGYMRNVVESVRVTAI